jgi:hypothetical protein
MRQFHLLVAEKSHSVAFTLDDDLGPPVFFLDVISDLRVILSAYDSSLVPVAQDDAEVSAILDSALRPYLRQCEEMSKKLEAVARTIVLANCYDLAKVGYY